MKTKLVLFVIFFSIYNSVTSQDLILNTKDSIVSSSWMFGVGYNFVDDSGSVFDELLSIDKQWNYVVFPSRISVGKYFKNGIGIEGIGSYNKYKVGKIIDGAINTIETDYFAIDARLSYDLNKIIGETSWFDPYIGVGVGYTDANNKGRGTFNGVIGFRAWFSDRIALDFNSSGKWAMKTEVGVTNHLQHAIGVVYQFKTEKELSKKGLEKRSQIEELVREQQKAADSVMLASKIQEEARLLAEKISKEKENLRLVEEAKNRTDTKNKRIIDLQSEINSFGKIYFALNSSYLDAASKNILDKIAFLLKNNQQIKINLSAHTDSRGTDAYNLWLSQKRMKRSLDYLLLKGVDSNTIFTKAFGEKNLLNNCDDDTFCKESEHKINRRIEFNVISTD